MEVRTAIVVARNRAEDFEGAMVAIEELSMRFGQGEGMAAVATDLGDRCRRLHARGGCCLTGERECGRLRVSISYIGGSGRCRRRRVPWDVKVSGGVGLVVWGREHG